MLMMRSSVLLLATLTARALGACDTHPENGGYYVEGVGHTNYSNPRGANGKPTDDIYWGKGQYYQHGEMKLCTGMFCSEEERTVGTPQYLPAHTCALLRFHYTAASGSTVYQMADKDAFDACDFTGAVLRGGTADGEPYDAGPHSVH